MNAPPVTLYSDVRDLFSVTPACASTDNISIDWTSFSVLKVGDPLPPLLLPFSFDGFALIRNLVTDAADAGTYSLSFTAIDTVNPSFTAAFSFTYTITGGVCTAVTPVVADNPQLYYYETSTGTIDSTFTQQVLFNFAPSSAACPINFKQAGNS